MTTVLEGGAHGLPLAKELRDAGFPQLPCQEFAADPDDPEQIAAVPDLLQLYEQCKGELRAVVGGVRWYAIGHGIVGEGDNLAEAMARLWLRCDEEERRRRRGPWWRRGRWARLSGRR
jgi:hypothetical protein